MALDLDDSKAVDIGQVHSPTTGSKTTQHPVNFAEENRTLKNWYMGTRSSCLTTNNASNKNIKAIAPAELHPSIHMMDIQLTFMSPRRVWSWGKADFSFTGRDKEVIRRWLSR